MCFYVHVHIVLTCFLTCFLVARWTLQMLPPFLSLNVSPLVNLVLCYTPVAVIKTIITNTKNICLLFSFQNYNQTKSISRIYKLTSTKLKL